MASSSSFPAAAAAVVKASSSSSSFGAVSLACHWRHSSVSFHRPVKLGQLLFVSSKGSMAWVNQPFLLKAQLNETIGGSSNDGKPTVSNGKDADTGNQHPPSAPMSESISEFMAQVASLVKLVDSRDIVELELKQLDCELIIRKKAALPQPPALSHFAMQQPPTPTASPSQYPPPPPPVAAIPSMAGVSSALPPTPPLAPKSVKSSHPPLKSPMAGTFYRSPSPGSPPFVKLGDKVKKGQVLCIIEAMKLMNDIEADQAGTVVEVLMDDGKPVGIDQPLFIIEP